MKLFKIILYILALLFLVMTLYGASFEQFTEAIHKVETGGRVGPILGDNGKALGPLQIHYVYWKDSGMVGAYKDCESLTYSRKVMKRYLLRYCNQAYGRQDWETCARVHNSGPNWKKKVYKTNGYWNKVKKVLYENNHTDPRIRSHSR